ncbi:MAG: YtxH domain-containing protein [Dehalococcoidales bacterium]|nr:YtxH domain-containing protein [Dehalococcoidales bacterium]
MNKDNAIGFGIGLVTGVAIGAVLALLFAPKSGKETRQAIKDKTGEVVDALKGKTEGAIDLVKDAGSEASRKGQAALHAIKN